MTTTNPTPTQPETLEPCPFCGSEAILLDDVVSEYDADGRVYHVTCLDSCSIAPGIYGQDSKEEAIRKWNSRPFTEPQAHVLSETLRYVRDQIDGDVDYFDLRDKVDAALKTAAAPSSPTPAESDGAHRCPHCRRLMRSDFDEDIGMWYECDNCDYREQVSNVAAPAERTRVEGEQEKQ